MIKQWNTYLPVDLQEQIKKIAKKKDLKKKKIAEEALRDWIQKNIEV